MVTTDLGVPGSLLQDEERARLEVQCAADDPTSQMSKNLARREACRIGFVRMDNDSAYRKALLRMSRPQRGPFIIGSYVYFARPQRRACANMSEGLEHVQRWYGPARVIGYEGDHEGSSHCIVLRYCSATITAAPEQLRFASEDELLSWNSLQAAAEVFMDMAYARYPARSRQCR